MTKYRENQVQATKMFEERKRDMMAKPIQGSFIKPGDENSKYYNKPDEAPISHPSEVLEKLRKDHPDLPMEQLVVMADTVVADEIRERQKRRLQEAVCSAPAPMEVDVAVVGESSTAAIDTIDQKPTASETSDDASSTA